jgi:uncharacterized membrane protein
MLPIEIAMTVADYPGHGHMDWDWGAGWWIVMVIAMFLFWGSVIYLLVRAFASNRNGGAEPSDPLQVLDRRLAEGLISPDEYRERKDILAGRWSGPESQD